MAHLRRRSGGPAPRAPTDVATDPLSATRAGRGPTILRTNPGACTEILDEPDPPRPLGDPLPAQLFDLEADSLEEHDLAAAHPDRGSRMDDELVRWFEEVTASA